MTSKVLQNNVSKRKVEVCVCVCVVPLYAASKQSRECQYFNQSTIIQWKSDKGAHCLWLNLKHCTLFMR